MGTISMYSNKTAWKGELEWSYSSGYVTVTMYTWKTDGYPSSASSGAHFQATITIGSSTKSFSFQEQESYTMTIGTHRAYVSGNEVYISGSVEAPYGVSMYNNPLTGYDNVVLYEEEEPETVSPSELTLSAESVSMGETLNISLMRYASQCTHILKYRPGTGGAVTISTGVGIYYGWKVPDLSAWCQEKLSVTVEISCQTYLNGVYCGTTTKTVEVLLPGATKPVCSATAVMGGTLAVTMERLCTSYTHSLLYALAEETGTIAEGLETAYTWTVPLELAKTIPLLTKGTAVLTCITYLNAMEVGRETVTVSLTVPDNEQTKPTASMILSPAGNLEEQFTGMYIRGRTGVKAVFTAESEYSQIRSCSVTVDGMEVTGNPAVSAYLRSHGEVTVTGRVTDARGYVRQISQQIQVAAYDRPAVIPWQGESSVVAVRCDADGSRNPRGQHLLIRAGRKYTALSTGEGQLNYCSLQYRIKKAGSEAYSDFYTLLDGGNLEKDFVQVTVENAVPELKTNYTVQLEAIDTLGGYSVITLPVAALTVPLHIGRGSSNVAVGKYCDYGRQEAFEIGLTTYFDKGIALRRIFDTGQWVPGMELGSSVAEAEVSTVFEYSLFIGVCQEKPVWLMRLGDSLYGAGIQIRGQGSSVTLEEAPAAITALYAVL